MADGTGKPYYWESMNINTTGENVGVVLDSLCDIVADNDLPASGKDTVKWVPGTEGKKGYFELGDGGGVIPGNEDQLVAADGQGKAKANIGMFYSKYDSSKSQSILQSPTPYVQFKSTSNAEESYYDYSHPMKLSMEWAPLLQFIGSNQYGSPVLSMNGRGVVDIFGGRAGDYNTVNTTRRCSYDTNYISYQAYNYYNGVYSPFDTTKKLCEEDLVYPLLQFKDSSTVLMEGCSLLHMSGGSSLFMDGNADVRINGSYINHGNEYQNWGRTYVDINPGSRVILTSSYRGYGTQGTPTDYVPLIAMTCGGVEGPVLGGSIDGQLILSCQESPTFSTGSNLYSSVAPGIFNFIGMSNVLGLVGSITHGSSQYSYIRNKLTIGDGNISSIQSNLSRVLQPSIVLQGRSHFCVGDQGTVGVKMAAQSGGSIAVDWTSQGNTAIKMGSSSGAISVYEIDPAAGSRTHFKFSPDAGASAAIAIQPSGIFSFQVATGPVCGISFTPNNTDLHCQWGSFDGVINSDDIYLFADGLNRIELREDAVIHMKGTKWKSDQSSSISHNSNKTFTIITDSDYSGQTIQDMTNSEQKDFFDELNDMSTFSAGKWHYVSGGTLASREYYPDRYAITLEGFSRSESGGSIYNCFYYYNRDRYAYNFSTMYNWPEFQTWFHNKFGPNATVTNGYIDHTYSASGGGYEMYWSGTVNNISETITSTTQYPIGTAYTDLSTTDRNKISYSYYGNKANTIVVANDVRTDMRYYTDITDFDYRTGTQNGEDWSCPVQPRENGPVFQLYDRANICMRNRYIGSGLNFTYILDDITETYDFTQPQYDVITQFLNSADYTAFLNEKLNGNPNLLSDIISLAEGDEDNPGTKLYIVYVPKSANKENYIINTGDDPILELTGPSELRIHNGATIKAETQYGRTTITFGGTADEGEVSFTIDELKYLKHFIGTLPSRIANNDSEATEPNTLYFIPGE